MEFCHISPTNFLDGFCGEQSSHLLLAHLVEQDQQYSEWYQRQKQVKRSTYILDNSAFELYKQKRPMYESTKLLGLAKQVNADYVVMSDYPNQPWEVTRDAALDLGPKFKNAGFGTFYCPQSEIGEIDDLVKSFRWAASTHFIDYIGVSILAVPNAYKCEQGNKLQRFLARWHFMQLLESEGVIDLIRKQNKKLHFLGMTDGPNEIRLVRQWADIIRTWDSSAAVWAGLNNIKFDNSPTGLIDGKLETDVDFSRRYAYEKQVDAVKYNIKYINNIIMEICEYGNDSRDVVGQ